MTPSPPRGTFGPTELTGEKNWEPVVFGCDEFGGRVSSFECERPSEPAAATKMTRCSSQGVPGFPVTALPVSPHIDAESGLISLPQPCAGQYTYRHVLHADL